MTKSLLNKHTFCLQTLLLLKFDSLSLNELKLNKRRVNSHPGRLKPKCRWDESAAGGLTKWQLEDFNPNSLHSSDFRKRLEVICQPGVCFNVQWTEASLSLKGNCRLVRRKPERTRAGRQAGRRKWNDWNFAENRRKSQKKKKKADSQKDPKKKREKKKWELVRNNSGLERRRQKNQPFTVSCLEVSVTDENLCEAPVSPHVILMRGNSPEEAPRTLSEEGGGEPQLKDTCLLSNCTSVLKFVCFSLQLQHFIF